MLCSLAVGIIIVAVKVSAYQVSGSMAVMADMIESLVHNLAVLFAAYCLWLSHCPPDSNHLYGHGKVQFLSAAAEGALVCGAGLLIVFNSIRAFYISYALNDVRSGIILVVFAAVLNSILGWWLIRTGKRENALILIANGKHVLSDVVTTGASLAGMVGAWLTGIIGIDLAVAVLGGGYILFTGMNLLRTSVAGLMDEADQTADRTLRTVLADESNEHQFGYHALRHRSEGNRHWVEMHLVLDQDMSLEAAHDQASHLETMIRDAFKEPVTVTTHLEPHSDFRDKLDHTKSGQSNKEKPS